MAATPLSNFLFVGVPVPSSLMALEVGVDRRSVTWFQRTPRNFASDFAVVMIGFSTGEISSMNFAKF